MVSKKSRSVVRVNKHRKIRNRLSGTAECPRLDVFRSAKHIYAQLIDDVNGSQGFDGIGLIGRVDHIVLSFLFLRSEGSRKSPQSKTIANWNRLRRLNFHLSFPKFQWRQMWNSAKAP